MGHRAWCSLRPLRYALGAILLTLCELCGCEKKSIFRNSDQSDTAVFLLFRKNLPSVRSNSIRFEPLSALEQLKTRRVSLLHDLLPLFFLRWQRHRRRLSPAQTHPHTDVVGQTRPQRLHPHLAQSAHTEPTQPKLLLDPQIRRLRHLRSLPIDLPRLFALHLLPELRHFGELFTAMNRSPRHPIARTALASNWTSLAVRPLGSIPLAYLHVPLFFPLVEQNLSLRTPITVASLIIDKL
jgi:hypothetical protein